MYLKIYGADISFIWLHKSAKFVEFSIVPIIGFTAAIAYGQVKKLKFIAGVTVSHIAFEIAALLNNWVFSVDAENVYLRLLLSYRRR